RYIESDGSAGIETNRNIETEPPGIERRIGHTVIGRQPDDDQLLQAPLLQIAAKAGRRRAVVLVERRVAVDRRSESLANDQLRLAPAQPRMEFGARSALHAVVGPQCLVAVRHANGGKRGLALVAWKQNWRAPWDAHPRYTD